MGMIYLKDKIAIQLREVAKKERRSPSGVIENFLDESDKKRESDTKTDKYKTVKA